LIDVRNQDEYDEKHIVGSILIPLDTVKENISDKIKNKDTKIIAHCKSGKRSAEACEILVDLGYTDVSSLDGGIEAWPYQTE